MVLLLVDLVGVEAADIVVGFGDPTKKRSLLTVSRMLEVVQSGLIQGR